MDSRLTGRTAENILLSLLDQQGLFATALDTQGLDAIIFDRANKKFKIGTAPFYVQIKCRGASGPKYNPQGHSPTTINKIRATAKQLAVPLTSVYFAVGFYNNADIRTIKYFVIPFENLPEFKTGGQYRFSMQRCTKMRGGIKGMFRV